MNKQTVGYPCGVHSAMKEAGLQGYILHDSSKTLKCSHGEQISTQQGLGMVLGVTAKGEHEGVFGVMEMFCIPIVAVAT